LPPLDAAHAITPAAAISERAMRAFMLMLAFSFALSIDAAA